MIRVSKQTTIAILLGLLCIVSFITLAALLVGYVSEKNRIVSDAKLQAEKMALVAATKIEQKVGYLSEAERIAREFSDSDIFTNQQNIEDKLKVEAQTFPSVSAFTLAFNPKSVPDSIPLADGKSYERALYSPYTWRDGHDKIYVMNTDGSNQTRPPDDPGYPSWDTNPSWSPESPDGNRIAFRSDRDGNDEIYVMDVDGSNQTRLTDNPGHDRYPSWSPDGTKIAFRSNRDGNDEIYVMDADGSNQTRLTDDLAVDLRPSWSPDGARIAFTSYRDGDYEIYVMDADGSNPTNLTDNPAWDFGPSWSPDGTKIAFISDRDGDTLGIIRIEDTYDYTLPDPWSDPACDVIGDSIPPDCYGDRTIWYHGPVDADEPVWSEPYFGSSGPYYWVGFGAPFYNTDPNDGQKVQAGMISADMTLDDIQNMVASLTPGKPGDGYGFIVSGRGVFVSHPIDKYVAQRKSLSDFDPSLSVEYLEESLKAKEGKRILVFDHVDVSSNQTSWVFFAPVKNAGWWIGISLDKEQILRSSGFLSKERKTLGRIVSALIIFLSSALALIFKVHTGDTRRLWYTTISLSLLLMAGIVFLWHMNLGDDPGEREKNLELADPAITAKVVADIAESIETLSESKAVEIPIGAFLRSIEFSGGDRTTVAGYIWHKNPDATPSALKAEEIAQGFTLPDAQEIDIREVYRREEGGLTTVGSNFSALIRQRFDFTKYPFDRGDIRIRIWPSEFSDDVFLSPDLDAYATTDPQTLPGLDQEMVLEGWDVSRSFFSYRSSEYNTNFGISNFKSTEDSLELYFNVSLRRSFITPLLSNFIPIGVVALLLFAVLATTSTDAGITQRFGFTTAAILGLSAGLFFVVIIAHINLRDDLATQGVIYLESFYFVLYGAILVIALNSLLVTSSVQYQVVRFRDNMVPKLLYWPIIMLISFVVTLFAFT